MDAIILISIGLYLVLGSKSVQPKEEIPAPVVECNRTARLNETFYCDEEAFYEIAHALGFPREM